MSEHQLKAWDETCKLCGIPKDKWDDFPECKMTSSDTLREALSEEQKERIGYFYGLEHNTNNRVTQRWIVGDWLAILKKAGFSIVPEAALSLPAEGPHEPRCDVFGKRCERCFPAKPETVAAPAQEARKVASAIATHFNGTYYDEIAVVLIDAALQKAVKQAWVEALEEAAQLYRRMNNQDKTDADDAFVRALADLREKGGGA